MSKHTLIILLVLVLLTAVVITGQLFKESQTSRAGVTRSASAEPSQQVMPTSGGTLRWRKESFSGYGWSTSPQAPRATTQALSRATQEGSAAPNFVIVFYGPQFKAEEIRDALHKVPNVNPHIFGMSTHEGILCADGYHTSKTGVIGLVAVQIQGISPGVGCASFEEALPAQAAKLALRRAIADAGPVAAGRKPAMIFLTVTSPNEDVVVASLGEESGPNIPLIGGTTAGSIDVTTGKRLPTWSMIANDQVIKSGVAVTVFYSERDFAWSFGGGYRRTSTSGVVTKGEGRIINEIDHRPAAEVYDQWLGGRVTQGSRQGINVAQFCALYPLCQTEGTYNQFIRVWPSSDPKAPGSLQTLVDIHVGETLYFSEGTWNILLNHFASVPQKARDSRPDLSPMAGVFVYCGGAMSCIPPDQRPQMAFLVEQSMKGVPWMGVFSWGEQGNIPNVGNLHSSLSAATAFMPAPRTTEP